MGSHRVGHDWSDLAAAAAAAAKGNHPDTRDIKKRESLPASSNTDITQP